MISTHTFSRRCLNVCIYAVVSVLVLAAVLLSLARLLLPTVEDFKPDVELWVSELVGQQIEIASLDATLYGFEPQLVLRGVQLLSKDRSEAYGHFQQARLGLNIFASIAEGRFIPGAFTIEGARFVVLKHEDGHVSVQGLSGAQSDSDDQTDVLKDWFFKQRVLDVKDSEIVWRDLKSESPARVFSNVDLRFRNDDERHVITGSVSLPEALGTQLKIVVDAQGDLLSGNGWYGNAYFEGSELALQQWGEYFPFEGATISDGVAGFQLWTQWRKAQLYSVRGSLLVNQLKTVAKSVANIHVIDNFSTVFSAQRNNNVWEATLDKLQISSNNQSWPNMRLDTKFLTDFSKVDVELTSLDLNKVLPIVALLNSDNAALSNALGTYKPKGLISNIVLQLNRVNDKWELYAQGDFSRLQNSPHDSIPGVDGVNGHFAVTNSFAKVIFPQQGLTLHYPAAYSDRNVVEDFQATLFANYSSEKLEIIGNEIFAKYERAEAKGSLRLLAGKVYKSALLDLAFYFNSADVASADLYTPQKLLPVEVINWLDESLLGGQVSSGGIMFYGSVGAFPFKEREGVFNVNLNIVNSELLFAPSWPKIDKIDGVFDLRSYGFWFYGESGNSMNSALSNVDVSMPSFDDEMGMLFIKGTVDGDSKYKSQYLHESPLEDIFAKHIRPLTLEGPSTLELNLAVPLNELEKTRVTGLLTVKDNHLFSDEWNLDIDKLEAGLSFSNESVVANNVSGYMGPVAIERGRISTIEAEAGSHLQITYSGEVDADGIRYTMGEFLDKPHWAKFLSGSSVLDFTLDIPLYSATGNSASQISVKLSSTLENMAVDLPTPLGKTADEVRKFSLYAEVSGKNRALNIQYGNVFTAFEFSGSDNLQRINRGAVNFSGPAVLPKEFGFRYTGSVDYFSWEAWKPIIFPPPGERPLFEGNSGGSGDLHYFDISFDELELMDSLFKSTRLQASSSAQQWAIHFDGPQISGKIFIPVMMDRNPIRVKMDRIYLVQKTTGKESGYLDPREMPALDLSIADFKYNDIAFGEFSLIAKKIDTGLFLDKLRIESPDILVEAKGNWTEISNKQQSKFAIKLSAKNLGKALGRWGYANKVSGGKGAIDINATWKGKPSDFNFKSVDGSAEVALKDINLLTFDVGPVKMFGLFLPRRLLLDFRDLFSDGIHFDNISGKYKIENGDAFTSELKLEGPLADIELAGRVGLVAQDYDQVVTINRHLVSDSLPLVAAALAAAPIVGAQVYVVKKLFETQIDDILSVQYTLLGSWEDPVIKKVGADSADD